ncbi:MAG TPA: tetratricopeptide repeat protein [Thioalkalivibrio sp.]|nr:tetratricopeptide repeat protein [Thioalkalivibrio sp.]
MADYNNEDEQLEALKQWWKENGAAVIAGIVLGAGALFGWKFWQDYQVEQAEAASAIYAEMRVEGADVDTRVAGAETLKSDYARGPYAALAALEAAAALVEAGRLADAEAQLRWAMDSARMPEVAEVARLRLAQVVVAQGRAQDVLDLLKTELPEAYAGLVDELRGDAYRLLGDVEAARRAYDRALLNAGSRSEYLQLKRDDLGRSTGVSAS